MSRLASGADCGCADLLPGRLVIEPGTSRDYVALEHFHYLPRRPSSWAQVWRAVYRESTKNDEAGGRLAAVGVLSWPVLNCRAREQALGLEALSRSERARFANAWVRVISRVVVHPQFRSLGLASALVRRMLKECPTRYVEAMAVMGHAHPLFEKAGMRRIEPPDHALPVTPVYYLFDRGMQT